MPELQESQELTKLKSFLNQLFQFESQDLDFGIYKILNYKRKEIKDFIDNLLTNEVKKQLELLNKTENERILNKISELEVEDVIKGFINATDEYAKKVLLGVSKEKIEKYLTLKEQLTNIKAHATAEAIIYNHLTLFFSRYYDKGDFISKRRYGKTEKYVVPYNGEETHFYWANNDQYYIKSSEYFNKYAFKLEKTGQIINFKLKEAEEESGNEKAENNKYFMICKSPVEIIENEINIYFEYRGISEAEKTGKGKKQVDMNKYAADEIKKELGKDKSIEELYKYVNEEKELTKIQYELNRYTNQNKYDFFIHKNLKGFLTRELDFYIKSEMLNIDDLTSLDSDTHIERIRLNFKEIKTFRSIANKIIDFVSQIEDFQKRLWEKKKFVINTEYVITLDKLAEYTSSEFVHEIIKEVVKNEKQTNEWLDLFGEDILPKNIKSGDLFNGKSGFKKLPIDTFNFEEAFKWKLLCEIGKKNDIYDILNGLVIKSDNYQGIELLKEQYRQNIDCIHIDPPYNANTSGFLYKNNYKHSSWLSMIDSRVNASFDLLSDDASYLCHIDENEYEYLYQLFLRMNLPFLGTLIWDKKNPMMGGNGLALQHEYVIWASKHTGQFGSKSENIKLILNKAAEIIRRNKEINENARNEFVEWIKNEKELSGGDRMYQYIENDGRVYRLVAMTWPNPNPAPKEFFIPLIHPVMQKPCPVPNRGWSRSPTKMKELLDKNEIVFGIDETTQPQRKIYLELDKKRPLSTVISSGRKGKADLESLGLDFTYCHPTSLYVTLLGSASEDNNVTILDFFPGSGTSFHAVQILNERDSGSRKCILIEQEKYVYTTILPRIKKISYSSIWKDKKPSKMNGKGIFLKYQRLEQYEDAIENIAFTNGSNTKQLQIGFKDYLPKYFLNFETENSNTFLNIGAFKNPFAYTLKVFDRYQYKEQIVDVIETFNYLIGLYVNKYELLEDDKDKYILVYGRKRDDKKVLIIWRNAEKLDYKKDKKFITEQLKRFEYDELYINHQASIEDYETIENVFKNKMN
jgi:adenine-specific DNA-methyltransferase